jgi:hypothetical protein
MKIYVFFYIIILLFEKVLLRERCTNAVQGNSLGVIFRNKSTFLEQEKALISVKGQIGEYQLECNWVVKSYTYITEKKS